MYTYKGIVKYVVDGDTIDVLIDLGFSTFQEQRLRLHGIDAYEVSLRGDTTEEEKRLGIECKYYLQNLLTDKEVLIKTTKDSKCSFGRYLAKVFLKVSEGEDDFECLTEIDGVTYLDICHHVVKLGYGIFKDY